MNFQHGDLYDAGSFQKAAQQSPKLLHFAQQVMEIGEERNGCEMQAILQDYPEIEGFIAKPASPIVLKLPELQLDQVKADKGDEPLVFKSKEG